MGDTTVSALEDVNLHVDEAAFVVILGPSGCGKTPLLNVIGALDTPTEGTIRINGKDITHSSRSERFDVRRQTVASSSSQRHSARGRLAARPTRRGPFCLASW